MGIELRAGDGVTEVVIDFPPVNALPAQGWTDLAQAVTAAGADPASRTVAGGQVAGFGTVLDVVPPGELRAAARAVAAEIAAKDPAVIALAKRSLNGIDPVDVRRSYRYEQGFTFELSLAGAGDAAR